MDLYGYTLSVAADKFTAINNYGNLEITDSSVEKKGSITGYGIRNTGDGTVKIIGVTIDSRGESGIYNANNGNIEVIEGTVSGNYQGIYNKNDGAITIHNGTIKGKKYFAKGIHNNKFCKRHT